MYNNRGINMNYQKKVHGPSKCGQKLMDYNPKGVHIKMWTTCTAYNQLLATWTALLPPLMLRKSLPH